MDTYTDISTDESSKVIGAQPNVVGDAHKRVFLKLAQAIEKLFCCVPAIGYAESGGKQIIGNKFYH